MKERKRAAPDRNRGWALGERRCAALVLERIDWIAPRRRCGFAMFVTKKGIQVIELMRYRALGKKVVAVGGGLVFCASFAGAVAGQGLPAVPGLTVLQQPVATTVQNVCIA